MSGSDSVDWSFTIGPLSAGAGSSASTLLRTNATLAECLATCEEVGEAACAAIDYVQHHGGSNASAASVMQHDRVGQPPDLCNWRSPHPPAKKSCHAVHTKGIHSPCIPPTSAEAEHILAVRRTRRIPPKSSRSVLLAIFDDLRVVDAPYAAKFTPNARAFAARATTFMAAHAQTALCAPSRASFLSGRRPDLTRVHWTDRHLRQWPPNRAWVTLPQHFRDAGYYVAAAGKLFHKMADPHSLDPQSWSEPECVASYPYFGQGACPEKPDVLLRVFNTSVGCPVEPERHPKYAFTDRSVLKTAIRLLQAAAPEARNGVRPFWLGVGFFKPHKPFVFPAELMRKVPHLSEVALPRNSQPPANMAPMANIPELCTSHGPNTPEAQVGSRCMRENIRMYHAAAAFTDGLLGELLAELESQRLHLSTVVAVMSDHGFALGEHGSWAKWTNWEVATRVPFAIRAPWLPASVGKRISTIVELVDLYPTLADLAGVPLRESVNSGHSPSHGYVGLGGRSLASLIEQPRNDTSGVAFSQIARCWPTPFTQARDDSAFSNMAQCDGVDSSDYAFMGYSMRTSNSRFTEWVPTRWDSSTARHMPQWEQVVGAELYDHSGSAEYDLGEGWSQRVESANVASIRPKEVGILRQRLRAHFDNVLKAAA